MAKKKAASKAGGEFKLQPLGDRLVIERAESESVTAGGIVLPDSARTSPLEAWSSALATDAC